MKYEQAGEKIIITGLDSFDLGLTLECGQCFNETKLSDNLYAVTAYNKLLHIEQTDGATLMYPCTLAEFETVWFDYFDLGRDYRAIKETLSGNDYVMRGAVEYAGGIRVLNQEPWECLISFILSQNNRIPMIKKAAGNIRERFGERRGVFFAFPTPERLAGAAEDELRECKTGFRAKYIIDAARKVHSGELDLNALKTVPSDGARRALMNINGVGGKIADCVLLFSLGHRAAFPIDVWISRVMRHFYFGGGDAPLDEIHRLAGEKYGEYGGYANMYLFAYARQFQIGK